MIAHHFSVDLEEYFQVAAFEPVVARSAWAGFDSRIVGQVNRLLELLGQNEARATFFVVGWVAARQRELIRAIASGGHEIASHSWDHARVNEQTPRHFRESIRRTKCVLEDISGAPVWGFRAPNFSIVPGCEWALDLLVEEGYRYDSSLFPARLPAGGLGYPGAAPDPHWLVREAGELVEIPPTTLRCGGLRLPAAGGAYFRLLPYRVVRTALRQCERRGVPGTFYMHPWEIDPDQPRLDVPWLTRVRHYGGLPRMERRIERLLVDFRFTAIRETVSTLARPAESVVGD